MAVQDYQITPLGHSRIQHNGATVHAGRKLSLDSANPVVALLVKYGYLASVTTATTYEGDAANLTTYTVTAKGAQHINHNGLTLAQGATLAIEPGDDTAKKLLAQGYIQ